MISQGSISVFHNDLVTNAQQQGEISSEQHIRNNSFSTSIKAIFAGAGVLIHKITVHINPDKDYFTVKLDETIKITSDLICHLMDNLPCDFEIDCTSNSIRFFYEEADW
ncbi:hypothetical protein [Methanobrevibacter sp. DSM 116169]|uniref:hypothetical protein n=1 Tax=Methanobrevibacter sp. DSM 116169 TaxID=3242727 RepID=UPI0038FC0C57